jgi:hypothetical protein
MKNLSLLTYFKKMKILRTLLLLISSGIVAVSQPQFSDDEYTRYELLDPATQSFRILYDVSATTPGALFYFNALRKGSEHKVDEVIDRMTGKKPEWTITSADDARRTGMIDAEAGTDYLKIKMTKPVPVGGENRLRIDKTYKDGVSYFIKDDRIVFDRTLGIKRNAIVLPKGYELIKCNYPAQVMPEPDGKLKISFINTGSQNVPVHIEARKLPATANTTIVKSTIIENQTPGQGRNKSAARINFDFPERANQTREIVYFLQQPGTNSFRLYHDYTEEKEGTDRYINVVRPGSKASNPSAKILDTGKELKVETLRGDAINKRGLDIGEPITPETEVVVIWYDAVQKGQTVRLRIEETYTDKNRYVLNGDEFIFDRAFGRPFNTVVLPEGWFLTTNAVPATVDLIDGNVSLFYVNSSPEDIDVYIKGRKR